MEERVFRKTSDYTGSNHCLKVKAHPGLNVKSASNFALERAVADKDLIKEFIKGNVEADEVLEYLEGGITNVSEIAETEKKIVKDTAKNIVRYIRGEKAKKRQISVGTTLQFPVGDEWFKESVDAVAVEKNGSGITGFEAITYKAGKPSVNMRTYIKQTDNGNMDNWFKLYTGLQYVKQLFINKVEEGEITLTNDEKKEKVFTFSSSYYFMCKTTDNKENQPRDYDFFSGSGGNVVTLTEEYTYNSLVDAKWNSELDNIFLPYMENMEAGVECSADTCKYCSRSSACQYVKTSPRLEKKKVSAQKEITLTKAQQAVIDAVVSGKKPAVRVNAGAGSGKTTVLSELYPKLIQKGVSPEKILLISFTETGTEEILQRCSSRCGYYKLPVSRKDIIARTFNAFGFDIVKDNYELLELPKVPTLLTDDFKLQLIEDLINRNTIPAVDMGKMYYDGYLSIPWVVVLTNRIFDIIANKHLDIENEPKKARDIIISELNATRNFKNISLTTCDFIMDLYTKFYTQYRADGFLTYSDQEPLMLQVFEKKPELLEQLGFEYIIVDEFQDSNEIQMKTLRLLTRTSSFKRIVVVGDDDQSIFAFRETGPEFIINFPDMIGLDTCSLDLVENRRSTGNILKLANEIINLNKNRLGKNLVSMREEGAKPTVNGFHSKDSEYDFIVDKLKKHHEEGKNWEDMAIIMATNAELEAMATKLVKEGIPYIMKNPMSLFGDSKVRAALSLSDAFYPDNSANLFDYLVAKYDGDIYDRRTDDEINYELEEMENIFSGMDLLTFEQQQAIFHNYLEAIRGEDEENRDEIYEYFLTLLYADEDFPSELRHTRILKKFGSGMKKKLEQDYVGVTLTTAHSSKGMEWDIVFNSITKYDTIPFHTHAQKNLNEIEEKRRLLFVSMTRAKDCLYITGQYLIGKTGDKDDIPVYNKFLADIFTLLDTDYDPIDHDAEKRQEERKEAAKAKAREKRRKQALLVKGKAGKELTPEEKKEYERLCVGSYQTSLF